MLDQLQALIANTVQSVEEAEAIICQDNRPHCQD
jgi:hypothetical protein